MRITLAVLLLAGTLTTAHSARAQSDWQLQHQMLQQQQQLDDMQARLQKIQRAQREAADARQQYCLMNGIVPCF